MIGDISRERALRPGPGQYTLPSDFGYSYDKKFLNKLMLKIRN